MLPIHRVNERNKVSRVHDLRFRSLSKSEYRISLQKGSCAHLSYWTITLVFGRRFRLPLYLLAATGQDFRQFRGFRPDLWSAFVSTWTLHAADIHFPSPNILLFSLPIIILTYMKSLTGRPLPQRSHHHAELRHRDRTILVLVEQHERFLELWKNNKFPSSIRLLI